MNTEIQQLIADKKQALRNRDGFTSHLELMGFLDALVKLNHITCIEAYEETVSGVNCEHY